LCFETPPMVSFSGLFRLFCETAYEIIWYVFHLHRGNTKEYKPHRDLRIRINNSNYCITTSDCTHTYVYDRESVRHTVTHTNICFPMHSLVLLIFVSDFMKHRRNRILFGGWTDGWPANRLWVFSACHLCPCDSFDFKYRLRTRRFCSRKIRRRSILAEDSSLLIRESKTARIISQHIPSSH